MKADKRGMKMKRKPVQRQGNLIVELALLLPLLMLILVAVSDVSSAFRVKHVMKAAAREAARVASVTPNLQPNDPSVSAVLDATVQGSGVKPSTYRRSVEFTTPLGPGDPVTVRVQQDFSPIVMQMIPIFGRSLTLETTSVMRYEMRSAANTPTTLPPTEPPLPPVCGDGSCAGGENCSTCPSDCGACPPPPPPPVCGDGKCSGSERCGTCVADCGVCPPPPPPPPPPVCGDRVCSGGETCSSCGADCGACQPPPPPPPPEG